MPSFIALGYRILQQKLAAQSQVRVPEPSALMDGDSRPEVYGDGGSQTNLWAIHAFVGDVAAALGPATGDALDLACGTGHVARRLAQQLHGLNVVGVDLSEEMLALARAPRAAPDVEARLRFEVGNMLDLSGYPDGHFSLTTWTLAAHHAPDAAAVASTLRQMGRITHNDGAMVILDLGRLKTPELNQWYVDFAGKAYDPLLRQEFSQSVHAAYTQTEMADILRAADVPGLRHVAMSGLPTLQVLYRPAKVPQPGPRRFAPDLPDFATLPAAAREDYETITRLFKAAGLDPRGMA